MNKLFLLVFILLSHIVAFAQKTIASSDLNLRERATTESIVLKVIPKGTELKINSCSNRWCEVDYKQLTGFVSQNFIRTTDVTSQTKNSNTQVYSEAKYYKNSKEQSIQSPTYYEKAPKGASALCSDGSYSFSQSSKGTCSRHGGVKRWL